MESSSLAGVVKAPHVCPSLFMSNLGKNGSQLSLAVPQSQPRHGKLLWRNNEVKCAKKGASVSSPETQLDRQFGDDEIISEEELMGLGRLGGDKCKEVRGIAELLECLETEAIMGEDEGKEPIDYNRRARIFDKSSRVFQALRKNATNSA